MKADMITSKELSYVDYWASKIPMPGIEYSSRVIDQMKECYEIYKQKYQNKEYNLIFSDGQEICFEIMASNLCHMLGIDYQNIKGEFFDTYRNNILNIKTQSFTSFELLEAILEYAEKVIELDNNPQNRCKAINYYKSQIKCNIFRKLSDFEKFDFAAINYDSDDGKFDSNDQKLLFIPSNEALAPYFFMGIRDNGDENSEYQKYIVNTLMAPTKSDVKKYFDNQEVIIPTQILVSDNSELRKKVATSEEKIRLLTMYKGIVSEFGIKNNLNISGDYGVMLNNMATIESAKQYTK